MRRFGSALALATMCLTLTHASIYYASPGASGTGSSTDPCSITKATSLAPGDTLYLKEGTYYLDAPLYPHAGTSAAWVTIKNYGDQVAVIDGSRISTSRPDTNTVGLANYTEFNGITVQNGVNANVAVWGAHHVLIKKVTSTGAQNAGILLGSSTRGGTPGTPSADLPGTTSYVTVEDCTIYNCCRVNANRDVTRWTPALQTYQANNLTINHCNVYQNYGEGIGLRTTSQSTITNCTATDNYSVEIYMDNSAYITITGSMTDATLPAYYRNGHPAIGLLLACEPLPAGEAALGVTHITDSGGVYKGGPGRQFYRYTYDTWSDCDWPTSTYTGTSTCSFTSTYTGIGGYPNVLNINQ